MKFEFNHKIKLNQLKNAVLVSLMTEEFCNSLKVITNSALEKAKKDFEFKGKKEQTCIASESVEGLNRTIIFVGLGKEKDLNEVSMQGIGATILDYVAGQKIKSISMVLNAKMSKDNALIYDDKIGKYKSSDILADIAFGMALKSYRFIKYYTGKKSETKACCLKDAEVICKDTKSAKQKFMELDLIKENVFFCRNLVNEPSNVLNPESYAKICKGLSELGIEVEIFDEKKMKELGMNSLLGVGQGSAFESQFVIMKWNGSKNKKEKPVAFVGKGVTFDSGGISLKPTGNIEDMKIDMGGSAVVVSLMRLIAMRKAKVNAIGVIALVENMPSSTAQRPGDIVKSLSGQTIEILNTDAEGRLILADALYYTATKFSPKIIVDLATLTGAVMIALGEDNAGIFSNNDELVKELEYAANRTGEAVWRMPLSKLGEGYDKLIDSDIADVKNLGMGKLAGSITAAQFLQRFINKHSKWIHIDIAGVAYVERPKFFIKKGASGFGVRLLDRLIRDKYED
jgi:leucyl aminopeptidase